MKMRIDFMDPMLEALISFQVWDSAAALCLNPTFMSNIRFLSFFLSSFLVTDLLL